MSRLQSQLADMKAKYSAAVFSLVLSAAAQAFAPPPVTSVSEWSDEHRVVTAPSPELGPWRTSRTPYLRQIMDVCSPQHPARLIDLQKATQIGGTEVAVNVIGYYSDVFPQPGMVVLPSKDVAKEWAEFRFTGLFEATKPLSSLLTERHNRKGRAKNTTLLKRLTNGGSWKFAWSSSPKMLRSTPAAILIADEVDGFDKRSGREGEPVALLEKRFSNFDRGKYLRLSSPTDQAGSRIEAGFRAGDQRYYFVPCPHCKWFQRLVWSRMRWQPGVPDTIEDRSAAASYECIHCEKHIPEWHKTDMLDGGMWVATRFAPSLNVTGFSPQDLPGMRPIFLRMEEAVHPSFHINALYAPLGWKGQNWASLVQKWEASEGDIEARKVFVTTSLAETWVDQGETPDEDKLYSRREQYQSGVVPEQCCFVTTFVDVQSDRLEYEHVGWDANRGRWSISYQTIPGRTNEGAVWAKLEAVLAEPLKVSDGSLMPILAMGIDTGHEAATVYEFAKRHPQLERTHYGYTIKHPRTVVCTKGDSMRSFEKLIVRASSDDGVIRKRGGVPLIFIGTGYAKQNLFPRLRLPKPGEGETWPPNYYHFPADYELPYFVGLCSERMVRDGHGKASFQVIGGRRNEILDIAVGNWAVAALTGLERMPAAAMLELRRRLMTSKEEREQQSAPSPAPAQPQSQRSGWLSAASRPGGPGGGWFSR